MSVLAHCTLNAMEQSQLACHWRLESCCQSSCSMIETVHHQIDLKENMSVSKHLNTYKPNDHFNHPPDSTIQNYVYQCPFNRLKGKQ